MSDVIGGRDSGIGLDGDVHVGKNVSVSGASVVVARENSLERHDSIFVCRLNATEISRVVPIRSVVTAGGDAGVDSSGIAIPDVDPDLRHRFACIDIDVLDLEIDVDTIGVFLLFDVLANLLPYDVVRSSSDLWSHNTAGVGAKDDVGRGVRVVVDEAGLVVVDGFKGLKSGQVTLELLGGSSNATLLAELVGYSSSAVGRTGSQLTVLGRVFACIDGTSDLASQTFTSIDLALDMVRVVMLPRMGKGRSDQSHSSNGADQG